MIGHQPVDFVNSHLANLCEPYGSFVLEASSGWLLGRRWNLLSTVQSTLGLSYFIHKVTD